MCATFRAQYTAHFCSNLDLCDSGVSSALNLKCFSFTLFH